jgi:hypothetical protein
LEPLARPRGLGQQLLHPDEDFERQHAANTAAVEREEFARARLAPEPFFQMTPQ